jgi:predicted TIM-barrel fold metal-dependent hydrolase
VIEVQAHDAHIHLFTDERWADLAVFEQIRESAGIGRALVVGFEGGPAFGGNNDHILDLARTRDWIHPLAFLPATRPVRSAEVESLLDRGFRGVSIYLSFPGAAAAAIEPAAWRALDRPGVTVSINASPASLARDRAQLMAIGAARVLISHLGNPGRDVGTGTVESAREILAPLLALAANDRIGVKISGLVDIDPGFPHARSATAVWTALEAFGFDRAVWGSDFPPALDHVSRDDMINLPPWFVDSLSTGDAAKVRRDNLERILAEA